MPKKTTTITHVYEFTFRVMSEDPLDVHAVSRQFNSVLEGATASLQDLPEGGPVSGRELCFDEEGGDFCRMTEGHRGLHKGTTGRQWGMDDLQEAHHAGDH